MLFNRSITTIGCYLLIALIAFFQSARAADIYLNSDSNIANEIASANPGDTLVFEPGTYSVNLVLTSDKSLNIRGIDTTNTILQAANIEEPVILVGSSVNSLIRNLTFKNAKEAIVLNSEAGTGVEIRNNVFWLPAGDAITIFNGANPIVRNNTFYANSTAIYVETLFVSIKNNIFYANNTVFNDGGNVEPLTEVRANCIGELAANVIEILANDNEFATTPLFVDVGNGDFHLTDESPCRNLTDEGLVLDENEKDPDGTLLDYGAFGGRYAEYYPNAVLITETNVLSDTSAEIKWNANEDYQVDSYKIYYNTSPLKGSITQADRTNLTSEATSGLSAVISGLSSATQAPAAPALSSASPSDSKLTIVWKAVDGATGYTVHYVADTEEAVDVGDVTKYVLKGLVNGKDYTITVSAKVQQRYYLQAVAVAEIENNNGTTIYESNFMLNDKIMDIGPALTSTRSNSITVQPEAIVPYPVLPNEGCFIATAAYGHYSAAEVQVLRDFRDQVLLLSESGRQFVKTYYEYGPIAAHFINEYSLLKPIVRVALYPLVWFAQAWKAGWWSMILLFSTYVIVIAGFILALKSAVKNRFFHNE